MVDYDYTPPNCKVSIWPEESFRDGAGGGIALTAATILPCDFTDQLSKEQQWPSPKRKNKRQNIIGSGRNTSRILYLGFEPGENTLEFEAISGMMMYYALGGCSTVGTAYGTPKTDALATRAGDHSMTVVTGTWSGFNVGAGGDMLKITSGTYINRVYPIYTWTVGTKTLVFYPNSTALPADIATSDGGGAPTVEIVTSPFVHTLSESDSLPSFALHIELENTTDAESIRFDLLGCVVKSFEMNFEAGGDTPIGIKVEVLVAKKIAGADLASPSPWEKEILIWENMNTLSLTYNAVEIQTMLTFCTKHSIKINNEIDMKNVFADAYPGRILIGPRTYDLIYNVQVQNDTWYNINALKAPNYAAEYGTTGYYLTAIANDTKIQRSATDYIRFGITKLEMDWNEEVDKFPDWEAKALEVPFTFHMAPGGALQNTIISDSLHAGFYEGGG